VVEGKQRKLPGRPYHPRVPLFPAGDLLGAEEGGASVRIEKAREEIEARGRAVSLALVHRGVDEVVDVFDVVVNPTVTQNLVSFTVPQGLVCKIDRAAIVCSEPVVAMALGVGWRLTLNGGEMPNIITGWGLYGYMPVTFGDLAAPMCIEPLWVQSGQTIAIEIVTAMAFADNVVLAGRLAGRLYKPASGSLTVGDL